MLEMVRKGNYEVLFTMGGYEMELFSLCREKFSPYVKIPLSEHRIFEKTLDKFQTLKTTMENNIPCPKTYIIDGNSDVKKMAEEIGFPVVIKPVKGEGPKGLIFVKSEEELNKIYAHTPLIIQEYIPYKEKNRNIL